jgi:hypothetical protein
MAPTWTPSAARWSRAWAPPAGCKHAVGGTRLGRRGRCHRHARDLPAARDAGPPLGPGRLRLRDAGPGFGCDQPGRHGGAAAPATCRAWRGGEAIAAFALSEPEAGSDVAATEPARRAPTATTTCWTARRPGSPTAASPTSTWSSRAPAKRPVRAASRLHRAADTPGFEIAERIDVIAPHPLARLRFTAAACRQPAHRRGGRRASRSRCARWTSSAPRWPRRRWALPGARWTRPCSAPPRARCSAACWPTSSSRRPSWRRWPPPSTAPRC